VPVRLINVGKTAAFKVNGGVMIELVPTGKEPHIPGEKQVIVLPGQAPPPNSRALKTYAVQGIQIGTLFPNDSDVFFASRKKFGRKGAVEDQVTTEPDLIALRDGREHFFLWGEVWYEDAFGVQHWTAFCRSQVGTAKCAAYNNEDRNPPPPPPPEVK